MKSWIVLSILAFLAPGKSYATSKGKPAGEADLYRLVEIEDHRNGRDPYLKEALAGKNPQLTARALLALGRIGEPEAAGLVAPFLKNAVADVRLHAAFALGLIKQPESLNVLDEAWGQEKDPKVRAQIFAALGRLQIPAALSVLEKALTQETHALAQSGLAMGFCFLFLAPDAASWPVSEATLATLSTQMKAAAPLGISAAWALARYKGDLNRLPEKELATAISEAREPEAKALALKALSRHKTPATAEVLKGILKNGESHNMRVEAASGLAGHTVEKGLIQSLLDAAGKDLAIVRAAALMTLATYQNLDAATQKSLEEMTRTQPSPWLQGKAYLALIPQLPADQRREVMLKGLAHPDVYVQREIIALLPQLGPEGLNILSRKASDPSILIAGAAVNTLRELDPEQMNDELKKVMLDQLSRHDPVISSTVIDAAGKFGWKDALPLLMQTADEKWSAADFSIQENLMGALISFNDPTTLPLIEKTLRHPVRNVVVKAAEAFAKVSGKPLGKALPVNNRVDEPTPALASIKKALDSEIVLETSKGTIRMVMLKEAPLTATKIVQWAQKGFYNALNFHRVVPHWVVQGGDPRGDGEGGDGMIRDEVSMAPHAPYTVGIATAGKDTGSTQMFFNLGDNTRLDGAYTVFAQVIDGRDVVDRLELGDTIIKATVQPFRGL
ncbi:MAG TPA: HEAT repeat domain-containing protein [Oligoflexus sp.]|uniref:HEAT repeat domain-containing protein n=1 Tax=Oligoflexus sp. TaxID=1971216 RepID=UPI002D801DE3|nr:HEAT repeat domain-containing protein [Oligoflexus sp.]HET9236014.1 HEAT repeat domain-containing protein [Oligoflexus sp.]